MRRLRHLRSASAFVALFALTMFAVATPALAAPISVHLEAELLTTNQASDVFDCCTDPNQKIVNATALVGNFSGGPAGSEASANVDMTTGIIKHRSAGEHSFPIGTFTGETGATSENRITDTLTVHRPLGATQAPFTFIMDYQSVLTLTSGPDLARGLNVPPNADNAGADLETSFGVSLSGPGTSGTLLFQSGLKAEALDVVPIKDLNGWTGFNTETRFTFEQYEGIFNGVGDSVAEPDTFQARLDATGTIADLLLRDDDKEAIARVIVIAPVAVMPPSDPNLHGVFETEFARQVSGEHRRLRHHQPNQIVSQQIDP